MDTGEYQSSLINIILNRIYCFSINHKTAPLSLIGRLQLTNIKEEIHLLKEKLNAKELIILQTCNRFEIYCYTNEKCDTEYIISHLSWLAGYDVKKYVNVMIGYEAIEHIFRVASGLESLMIGEWEIVDQVKESLKIAGQAGSLGKVLNTIFKKAVELGIEVRKDEKTLIGIPDLAVDFANKSLKGLDDKKVLVIGTGKAAKGILKAISNFKVRTLIIAGRSIEKVNALASEFNGRGVLLSDVLHLLETVDVVFVAISGKNFSLQLNDNHFIPLIIDISIPSTVQQINNEKVITLKTLEAQIQQNVEKSWVNKTESSIKKKIMLLDKFLIKVMVNESFSKLMNYVENTRKEAISYALRKLRNGDNAEIIIDLMSKSLVKRSMQPIIESVLSLAYKGDDNVLRLLEYINNNIKS
ncbi:MAG: glutamyl-tRNA reductase [Thermoprotei archaeon]|jgi:glutamyl-tRNA reductase